MRFVSRFLVPVALIVASTSLVLLGGLFWLTEKQDRMEAVRESQLVQASVDAQAELMQKIGLDYGIWDEMVRNAIFSFNRTWLDDNFGVYLHGLYGLEYVALVNPDGSTLYGVVDGKASTARMADELGAGYRAAATRLLHSGDNGLRLGGVTRTRRGLSSFAVSIVQPSSDQVRLPPGKTIRMVVVKKIDDSVVAELGKRTVGLKLTLGAPRHAAIGTLPLKTYDGSVAGSLQWEPHHPGQALRKDVAPFVGALLLAVLALAAGVLRRAWESARELVAGEARSRHLAHHDQLTTLPNRRAFTEHLLTQSRANRPYALLYMDLDGFKEVNDAFGHSTGDRLLQRTAERLLRASPRGAYIARLGGDEFALVLHDGDDHFNAEAIAECLIAAVRRPHEFGAEPIVVGVSIGIAIMDAATDFEEAVRRSDVAMYAAKFQGRNRFCLYNEELDQGRSERKQLEGALRRAIDNDDIHIVYQPIVRTADRKIIAVEALARWTHPTHGAISPDIFIPVAEDTGAIVELGRYVLREACTAARAWPYKLAVNLSPAQFWDTGLVEGVIAILRECDFPPSRLEFEITETYLLRRPEAAAEIIAALRSHGICVALDDFGTGYASIGYLRRFELDMVKLDRSFVEHVATDSEAADVAHAVIALGGALKLPILAEGVETEAQAKVLTTAGCSYMQGWHYGRPMDADDVPRLEERAA